MGLVRYDPSANKGLGGFKMTDVGSFISGGVSECKRMINMDIASSRALLALIGILTGVCVLSSCLVFYKKYKERHMERQI
jgi:hypothetical protein